MHDGVAAIRGEILERFAASLADYGGVLPARCTIIGLPLSNDTFGTRLLNAETLVLPQMVGGTETLLTALQSLKLSYQARLRSFGKK